METPWKKREPFLGTVGVIFWPWETDTQFLRGYGWTTELVTNKVTKRTRLYIRDPKSKMMGRSFPFTNVMPNFFHLEFLTLERNQRITPPRIHVENDEVIGITEADIPMVLAHIASMIEVKPKPKKTADVVELFKRYAA